MQSYTSTVSFRLSHLPLRTTIFGPDGAQPVERTPSETRKACSLLHCYLGLNAKSRLCTKSNGLISCHSAIPSRITLCSYPSIVPSIAPYNHCNIHFISSILSLSHSPFSIPRHYCYPHPFYPLSVSHATSFSPLRALAVAWVHLTYSFLLYFFLSFLSQPCVIL